MQTYSIFCFFFIFISPILVFSNFIIFYLFLIFNGKTRANWRECTWLVDAWSWIIGVQMWWKFEHNHCFSIFLGVHNHCIASPLLVLLCIIIYLFFSFPLFILKLIYNQIFCDFDPFVEIKMFRDICKDGSSSSGVTNSPHPRCVAESTSQPRWLPGVERTGAKATAAQEDEE